MAPTIKPYLVRNMLKPRLHGKHGICAVIRDMFIATNNVNVKYRLRIAMRQAKMLDQELREAKANHEKLQPQPMEVVDAGSEHPDTSKE